jgi:hypothetical protein
MDILLELRRKLPCQIARRRGKDFKQKVTKEIKILFYPTLENAFVFFC